MLINKERLIDALVPWSHKVKDILFTVKWYSWGRCSYKKSAVFVVDGRLHSCGMTDRFIGAVSLYAWAKQNGVPFKIVYTYPFRLTDFLVPSEYDWTAKEGDYVQNVHAAKIMYAIAEPTVVKRLDDRAGRKQIHFYGNRDLLPSLGIAQEQWGALYLELFKPVDSLRQLLDGYHKQLGSYFSVCFRFQNLLGDFSEYGFAPISDTGAKERLLFHCIEVLKELISKHPAERCLVLSDSVTFLQIAVKETGCMIIEGNRVHMGSTANASRADYEKSFVDFYLMAEGTCVYNVVLGDMYPSGFPQYAAKIYNIPFARICG